MRETARNWQIASNQPRRLTLTSRARCNQANSFRGGWEFVLEAGNRFASVRQWRSGTFNFTASKPSSKCGHKIRTVLHKRVRKQVYARGYQCKWKIQAFRYNSQGTLMISKQCLIKPEAQYVLEQLHSLQVESFVTTRFQLDQATIDLMFPRSCCLDDLTSRLWIKSSIGAAAGRLMLRRSFLSELL